MAGIWEIWSSGLDAAAADQELSEQLRRIRPGALVVDVPECGPEMPMAHKVTMATSRPPLVVQANVHIRQKRSFNGVGGARSI